MKDDFFYLSFKNEGSAFVLGLLLLPLLTLLSLLFLLFLPSCSARRLRGGGLLSFW
jgi:hypothetical protein